MGDINQALFMERFAALPSGPVVEIGSKDYSNTDGYAYIVVPWVWRYHAYPDDYFRYSWRGVSELFPGFDWLEIAYSTTVTGEFYVIDDDNKSIDDQLAHYKQVSGGSRKYLPYLQLHMFGRKLITQG